MVLSSRPEPCQPFGCESGAVTQPTFERYRLLFAKLVARKNLGLGAARLTDQNGRVGVVLLHGGIRLCEEAPGEQSVSGRVVREGEDEDGKRHTSWPRCVRSSGRTRSAAPLAASRSRTWKPFRSVGGSIAMNGGRLLLGDVVARKLARSQAPRAWANRSGPT